MDYAPEYAKGQILVSFKGCGKSFAHDFGRTLGFELIGEHNDAYVYKTEVGKEKEALERFRTYTEFVEWSDLRDVKMESRWASLEQAIDKIQELHDEVELPDDQYEQRLADICDQLKRK